MYPKKTITTRLNRVKRVLLRKRLTAVFIMAPGALAAGLLAFEAVEWLVHPWREDVAVVLVGALAAVVAAATAAVLCRLLVRRPSAVDLARRIEDKRPELMDSLVSAAEREAVPEERRRILERALIESVNEKTEGEDFVSDCAPRSLRTSRLSVWAVACLVALAAASSGRTPRKAVCGFLTLSDRLGPAIRVAPGDAETPARSDLTVEAVVERWGGEATIDVADADGKRDFPMNRTDDGWSFTFYDVTRPLRYRARTPSAATPWFSINVFTPPELEKLEWRATPPAYAGIETSIMDSLRDHSALEGSEVQFKIWKKPEVRAELLADDDVLPFRKDPPGEVETGSFTLRRDRELAIKLTDAEGHENILGPVTLRCAPDLAPVIHATSPGRDVVIPPGEKIELTARSADDFGVDAVNLSLSISGRSRKNFPLYPTKMDAGAKPDLTSTFTLDADALGAGNGDVVSYYFTAADNRRPNPRTSRTKVFFIELRPKLEPEEGKGGGEKKEMEIFKLIAELKRLIRFSYDFPFQPSGRKGVALAQLKTSFADLLTATIRQVNDIGGEKLLQANVQHPAIQALAGAVEELKNAKRLINKDLVEPSIPHQERALARFTALAHQLLKNQPSGEGEGKSGEQSSERRKSENEKNSPPSLKRQLETMRRLRDALRALADRQGNSNEALRQIQNELAGGDEYDQLASSQAAIQAETGSLAMAMKNDPIVKGFKPEIDAAEASMDDGVVSLERREPKPALRSGLRAHGHLLSAAESLSKLINRFVAANIQAMAEQAGELAEKQRGEAERSRREAEKGRPSRETAAAMKDAQDALRGRLDDLTFQLEGLAGELQKDHPAAMKGLMDALRNAEKNNLDGVMKRAANALLYRRPDKAGELQGEAGDSLARLETDIRSAADDLPRISREELANALRELLEAEARLREGGEAEKELRRISERTSPRLSDLAAKLGDDALSKRARAMRNLSQAGALSERTGTARRLLMDAAGLIQRRLMEMSLEQATRLNRKLSIPPERYRRLVEEYFKSLSDDEDQ